MGKERAGRGRTRIITCDLSEREISTHVLADTGLEPARPNLNHVLNKDAKDFWDTLKPMDVLTLYQHQTNLRGEPWEERPKECSSRMPLVYPKAL